MGSKHKGADSPRLEYRHQQQCAVCKSERCNEFEKRYVAGENWDVLAHEMGFEQYTAERHVAYMDLLSQRYATTLPVVRRFIHAGERTGYFGAGRLKVTPQSFVNALTLHSKLLGEQIEDKENPNKGLDGLGRDDLLRKQAEINSRLNELLAADEAERVKEGGYGQDREAVVSADD